MKLSSDGKAWSGPFFQMQQNLRLFTFSSTGYWCYPALVRLDGDDRVYWLHLVLDTSIDKSGRRLLLYRPRASAITPVHSTHLVEYRDFRFGHDPFSDLDWHTPVGKYPWFGLYKMKEDEAMKEEMKLVLGYDQAVEAFRNAAAFPKEFAVTYNRMTHPLLWRFLKTVAPDFVASFHLSGNRRKAEGGRKQQ